MNSQWINGGQPTPQAPKLPYVSTWAHFSKLPEEEKAKIFNNIRATLVVMKLMDEK